MPQFDRVVASIFTAMAGALVLCLAALIGRFCGPVCAAGSLRRYLLTWTLVVFAALALSIVLPSCGVTLYQHPPREHRSHHWDWD